MSDDAKLSDRLERWTSTWLMSLLLALGGVVGCIAGPRLLNWLLGVTDDQIRLKIAGISTGLALVLMLYVALLKWRLARRDQRAGVSGHDRELIARFLKELPTAADSIQLLHHQDFGEAFLLGLIEPLNRYNSEWCGADAEFDDPGISEASGRFRSCLRHFLDELYTHTCIETTRGGAEIITMGFQDGEMRTEKLAARKSMNETAEAAYAAHQALLRLFRQKQAE